jgi:uncharacterized protein (DUF1501 family)
MATRTRRDFIRKLALAPRPKQDGLSRNTLLCIFLRGGADTLNMLVPYGDDSYYRLRPTVSIPAPDALGHNRDAAIRLDDFYALHPKLEPLLPAFREGRLAFVQGCGSDNSTGSHFEAQDQMEHGEAFGKSVGGGWIARHLRLRRGSDATPLTAVAIGATIPESLRGAPSVSAISTVEQMQLKAPPGRATAVALSLAKMYGAEVEMLSQPGRQALELLERVESLRSRPYVPAGQANYPANEFAAGLRELARLIKAEVGLETACIDLGGWDTHYIQGATGGLQASVIEELAGGLAAFDADLLDYRNRVTVVIMTEFGRRVYENSSFGTDHGRGFALIAIGGRIRGGRIIGNWPGLDEQDEDGPGGLRVNIDYRSVLSEILVRFAGCTQIDRVFPGFSAEPVGLVN